MSSKIIETGSGLKKHHLIEQRFASLLKLNPNTEMKCMALTEAEHAVFTQAWRNAIGYSTDVNAVITTLTATTDDVLKAAAEIYKKYPEILRAIAEDVPAIMKFIL